MYEAIQDESRIVLTNHDWKEKKNNKKNALLISAGDDGTKYYVCQCHHTVSW